MKAAETAPAGIIDVDQDNANLHISSTNTATAAVGTVSLEDVLNFRNHNWGLRLSVSNVAAMAGFHPFTSLPQLMLQLVYQSALGQELLDHDCRLLGISLISEEDMLLSIATKAGTAVRDSVKQALAVQKGKLILKTNQDVTKLNQRVQLEASKAQKSDKKITENELTIIQRGVQQLVYRGYGTFHEQEAMDMYERQCGWEIRERNSVMVKWPFIRSEDVRQLQGNINTTSSSENPIIQGSQRTVVPLTSAIKSEITKHERPPNISRKRLHPSNIHPTIEKSSSTHVDTIDEKPIIIDSADAVQIQPAQRPFFCLYGSVDGIRDELWCDEEYRRSKGEATIIDHDEDDEWKLRQVVIECKHRMKKIHARVATASTPPPLYDQIQAVVYCLMYETTEADIIEVFRSNAADDESNDTKHNNNCHKTKDNNTNYNSKPAYKSKSHRIDIATSRITLYDPIHRHGEHWKSVILPRLRDFAEAVYTIRSDDGKRYELLSSLASMEEDMSWKLIVDECPWLKDCDTAYYRLQLTKT